MVLRGSILTVLAGALIANLVILLELPLWWQAVSALLLTGLFPAILFMTWLFHDSRPNPLASGEHILYVIGTGYSLITIVMLALSYLPGGLTRWHTLIAFDLLLLALALLILYRGRSVESAPQERLVFQIGNTGPSTQSIDGAGTRTIEKKWLWAGLLSLLLVCGFFRFTHLDYAEFQGDEARAMLRAAETIQGKRDALLGHRKGPVEILIPTAIYSLTQRINEESARLPFAFAGFAGLFGIFLLGWRLFGPIAGWVAAMLLALDGYLIGLVRIVQYQGIVFLMVVLVMLILYRLLQSPQHLSRYLLLASLFLSIGLLAHYEAILVGIPVCYWIFIMWRRGLSLKTLGQAMVIPLIVGSILLAMFYVPFVLNPTFANTYAYIATERIGQTFPYNNLADLFVRTTLYSTTYYFMLMIVAVVAALLGVYWRNLSGIIRSVASSFLLIGMVSLFWSPTWLTINERDYAWLFFVLTLGMTWFLPNVLPEERAVWLWFGLPMILSMFFVFTPNTHVYNFFIPWALLSGMVIERSWNRLQIRWGAGKAQWAGATLSALLILLFGNYAYWYFIHNEVEVLRTWRENRPWGYWISYDMPERLSIFGFPLRNGWKVVGTLYADGILQQPFDLNGKDFVADWYTRGIGNCLRDHAYYIFTESVEPADLGYLNVLRQQVEEKGYQKYGMVMVNEQPRLTLYKMGNEVLNPQQFDLDEYERRYDNILSTPIFEQYGPVANPSISIPLDFHFGETILLKGYDLTSKQVELGGTLQVTLYWQATESLDIDYKVFTQVINMEDFHKVGQLDGEPGCNRFPTSSWEPGTIIVDRYTIPIAHDARAGTYTLLIGMYEQETGARLNIFAPDGQPIGDALSLEDGIEVDKKATD